MSEINSNIEALSYEEALLELEALLQYIETGSIRMDDVLETVKRANMLLSSCQEKLKSIEKAVQNEI
jgi:exodeoxyribonuclease VII small subunit